MFSWTPACPVGLILVKQGTAAWAVQADSNRMLPPVRYGQEPAGTQWATFAPSLVRGDTCVVSVARWYSGSLYQQVGTLSFVY